MRNTRRARLVLTILLLAAFSLITLDYRSGALSGVRRVSSTVFGPIENVVNDVTHPIGSWFSSIGHLGSYKSENDALKKQIASLQNQLHLTAVQRSELRQDEKLLHLAGVAQYTVVPARVISGPGGAGSDGFDDTATINVGSRNGVRLNQTVINGDGLVGRTIVVGRTESTILLADDPTSIVGARLAGKQLELGSLQGGGRDKLMTLTLYSSQVPLTVGTQLVSAGDSESHDAPFVPEVPLGTITHVTPSSSGLAETALVKPFVDYTSIDVVAVVLHAPPTIKHDALLPASPTPAPTVTVTVTVTPSPGDTGSSSPGTTGTTSSGTTPTSSP